MNRVHSILKPRQHSVASFVPCCQTAFAFINFFVSPRAHHNQIFGVVEVFHFDNAFAFTSRFQSGFVNQFLKFGTGISIVVRDRASRSTSSASGTFRE